MIGTNLKILATVLITVGAYTLVANTIPQIQSDVPEALEFTGEFSVDELVSAGEALYHGAGGCTACHGLGTRAPDVLEGFGGLGPIGARCATRVEGMDCETYLHESLIDPNAYVVEGFAPIMPDMRRTLSETQILALVAFLQSLGGEVTVSAEEVQAAAGGAEVGGPEGAPRGGPASPGAGGAVTMDPLVMLQDFQCLTCHQFRGEGGPIGPPLATAEGADPAYVRRSILEPNADTAAGYANMAGTMPADFGTRMTAGQLEALVDFLVRGGPE
ncbi:MAG: c-type cytochrome [Longimicrobiales bacterium]